MPSQNRYKSALVVGCSFANGCGLDLTKHQSVLWPESLLRSIGVANIDNLSKSGANNHFIFLETASALIKKDYDIAIVAWSETARFNYNFGLELYSTSSRLTDGFDINLHNYQTVSKKFQKNIGDLLRRHLNYHWDILNLIRYVNILTKIKSKNLFFVNSLGVWSDNFFERKVFLLPEELSKFEKNLLDVDYRDDSQIIELYNYIHDQYSMYGGIQKDSWLNLYSSLKALQVDNASPTDTHPGVQSQKVFTNYLLPKLQSSLM